MQRSVAWHLETGNIRAACSEARIDIWQRLAARSR